MKLYIVVFRGINVGGHKKIKMAELREVLSSLGYKTVQTYIQSGNVVLHSASTSEHIKSQIEQKVADYFGFEVQVIVKSKIEFQKIFEDCPLSSEEKEKSYFMLLDALPDSAATQELSDLSLENEKFYITNSCIYFYSAVGYGRTKYNSNFFERKLKINATARNYKTMLKLLAIAEEAESKT